ncbi:MAG: PAS domain S-box protein [Nitrosomonas sp.]|nr:PAS domain S-box protein [Nitrosomonas sp.]
MQNDDRISALFPGDSEMARLMRELDWSKTPLGPTQSWSAALRMMVPFLLANRFPLLLWWGSEYVSIYNDAYRPILGNKHPEALGQPVSKCWHEIWPILQPLIDTPFNGGAATWEDDLFVEINRCGFTEETHFTVAYSPVPDDTARNGIGGVLATVHEITEKVVGERRVKALYELSTGTAEAKTDLEACCIASAILNDYDKDVPFALIYLLDADGKIARLASSAGVDPESAGCPVAIDIHCEDHQVWPLRDVLRSGQLTVIDDLARHLDAAVPAGPWSDRPQQAVVAPIRSAVTQQPVGVLVAGVSARLRLDDMYRNFYALIASQIAAAVGNTRAHEEEKKRAKALAEIDRAKTQFFSNVSHEFRTPLTLMLNPLEELLMHGQSELPEQIRMPLRLAHRNSLRLLKLVNSLLDFSRLEAGRLDANYEPTELTVLTADLASAFRSALEKAGLALTVDCPSLPDPVYIDRSMWEKIVLNLLSNAFKFTFAGEICVTLHWRGDHVELAVSDTGEGIPQSELTQIFQRFHRVSQTRSRTQEGTGIGLSLVHELVKLHGGEITVQSQEGKGSIFTVSIPTGSMHLPADQIRVARKIVPAFNDAQYFIEEAWRWLPPTEEEKPDAPGMRSDSVAVFSSASQDRILVVDDNADMRDYLCHLLSGAYVVEVVENGQAALEQIRFKLPDLVLADVMTPHLDGFGLLSALRENDRTKALPVILLSARAGEEARIEGLEAGADDYLAKPFSARELLARIQAHLAMSRIRQAGEVRMLADLAAMRRLYEVGNLCVRAGKDVQHCLDVIVEAAVMIMGADKGNLQIFDAETASLQIVAHLNFEEPFLKFFAAVRPDEASVCGATMQLHRRIVVEDITRSLIFSGQVSQSVLLDAGVRAVQSTPLVSGSGALLGMISTHFAQPHRPSERDLRLMDLLARQAADYLERKQSDAVLRESEANFRALVNQTNVGICRTALNGTVIFANQTFCQILDYSEQEIIGKSIWELTDAIILDENKRLFERLRESGESFQLEKQLICKDGQRIWVSVNITAALDASGNPQSAIAAIVDISERKQRELNTTFLDMIGKELTHLSTPDEIMQIAGAKLGEFLKSTGCVFADVNETEDAVTVHYGWTADTVPSLKQTFRLKDYLSEEFIHASRAGEIFVVSDTATDQNTDAQNCAKLKVGAFVVVPFHWNDRWTTFLAVTNVEPRRWRNDEIELMKEFSNRLFSRVERARAEKALRLSEARFRTLANTAPALIWHNDNTGKNIFVNQQYLDFSGLTAEQLLGTGWQVLVHPYEKEAYASGYMTAVREQRPWKNQIRLRRRDGKWRWFDNHAQPLFDVNDVYLGHVGVSIDVTERKQIEEALSADFQALMRMQALSGRMADGTEITSLFEEIIDVAVKIMLADKGTLQLLQGDSLQIVAQAGHDRDFLDFIAVPENVASVCGVAAHQNQRIVVPDVEESPIFTGSASLPVLRAAKVRAVQSTPLCTRNGRLLGILTTHWSHRHTPDEQDLWRLDLLARQAADFIEQKQSEESLRISEERFRNLIESYAQAVWETNADGVVVDDSPTWRDYTGQTFDEWLGYGWVNAIHPDDREYAERQWRKAISMERTINAQFRLKHRDQGWRWTNFRATPIRSSSGEIQKWVGMNIDIDAQKRAEESLQDADRRKDEFLATLAHELRNPLTPISNGLHILRMPGVSSDTMKNIYTMMERQVHHMVRLVDDLMEVSRITRGRIALHKEVVDLAEVLRSAVETSRSFIDAGQHQLNINLPADPLHLEADAMRLTQVFANLLNNAAKYTQEGGHIWLSAERDGTGAVISVRDDGMGISGDILPRIFDLFMQGRQNSYRAQSGLGVGLTLVKSLVAMHGGSVEAHSDGPGKGCEFVVRLPLTQDDRRPCDQQQNEPRMLNLTAYRILVVDDNDDAAETLAMMLRFMGAEVMTANDALSALAIIEDFHPAIVFLDIGMPDMDGFEIARRIRQRPDGREMTLIALTGWGQEKDQLQSREAGIDHHLIKPVDLDVLKELLAGLMITHPILPDRG